MRNRLCQCAQVTGSSLKGNTGQKKTLLTRVKRTLFKGRNISDNMQRVQPSAGQSLGTRCRVGEKNIHTSFLRDKSFYIVWLFFFFACSTLFFFFVLFFYSDIPLSLLMTSFHLLPDVFLLHLYSYLYLFWFFPSMYLYFSITAYIPQQNLSSNIRTTMWLHSIFMWMITVNTSKIVYFLYILNV